MWEGKWFRWCKIIQSQLSAMEKVLARVERWRFTETDLVASSWAWLLQLSVSEYQSQPDSRLGTWDPSSLFSSTCPWPSGDGFVFLAQSLFCPSLSPQAASQASPVTFNPLHPPAVSWMTFRPRVLPAWVSDTRHPLKTSSLGAVDLHSGPLNLCQMREYSNSRLKAEIFDSNDFASLECSLDRERERAL